MTPPLHKTLTAAAAAEFYSKTAKIYFRTTHQLKQFVKVNETHIKPQLHTTASATPSF